MGIGSTDMSGSARGASGAGSARSARRRFGILAYPAGQSLSPLMFNAAFEALGMGGTGNTSGASYEVFEIAPPDFDAFMRAREFDGLSVSAPYKERVMGFLDFVDEDARKIGAVNTVSKGLEAGTQLSGFNTDFVGAVEALEEKRGSLHGKKVVILGAGGAARAITYGLLREGAEVVVLNRNLEEAKRLGEDLGVEVGLLSSVTGRECDILIQATSVWMTSGLDVKIVPDSYVAGIGARSGAVMDIVYKPLMTPLLEVACEAGCRVITGEKMLLNQAVKQFEIWFGEELATGVVREIMGKVLEEALKTD